METLMKNLLILVASLFVSSLAVAEYNFGQGPTQSAIQDADYLCGNEQGAFAFKVSEPMKVWQTEINSDGKAESGLDIIVTDATVIRSPHHYIIKGFMDFGGDQKNSYSFFMTANHVTKVISLATTILDPQGEELSLEPMTCTVIK